MATIGDTITDGTVVWQVTSTSGVAGATSERAGILKMYQTSGNNADGTISQKGISDLLNDKLNANGTAQKATTAYNVPTASGLGNIWIS